MTFTFLNRMARWMLLFISVSFVANAQENEYEIGLFTGMLLRGSNSCEIDESNRVKAATGITFRYVITARWCLKSDLVWGKTEVATRTKNLIGAHVQAEFNFFPYLRATGWEEGTRITPFILFGIGVTFLPGSSVLGCSPHISGGVGMKYKVTHRISIGCEFSYRQLVNNNLTQKVESDTMQRVCEKQNSLIKNKDTYSLLQVSVSWVLPVRTAFCKQ